MKFHIISKGKNVEFYIERHVNSVVSQCVQNYSHVIALDPCEDMSLDRLIRHYHQKMRIIQNKKQLWGMQNIINGINIANPHDEDIISILDVDDLFYAPDALAIVEREFEMSGCLISYGSFVRESTGNKCNVSQKYLKTMPVRKQPWHGSHLKCFKYKLWKQIPDTYLKNESGEYFRYCDDMAFMFAMIELAGWDKVHHISEPLVIYNDLNYMSSYYNEDTRKEVIETEKYIRGMKPLS